MQRQRMRLPKSTIWLSSPPTAFRISARSPAACIFDALGNPAQIAGDVLICDATGRHPAPSTAAEIAAQERK